MALQDELLKLIRAEIAERQWPDVEVARRAGWSQSRMSRALNTPRKLAVNDLETILCALGVEADELVRTFTALIRGESSLPAASPRTAEHMLSNPPDWARFVLDQVSMRNKLDEYAGEIQALRSALADRGKTEGG